MPTRLPIPGSDEGQWGEILNQFLSVEHNDDGSLKSTGSLAAKANDNDVVKVAGNQTVGGVKTFSSAPSVPDESFAISKTAGLSSALASKYTLPGGGIPESDLATAVQAKLNATGGSGTPDDGSVTTDKLDNGAVTDEKVAVDASISQSKIANLTTDLSGKANSAHNHSWQDITTGTQPAPVSHGHTIADVTGLQDELTSLGDALDDKLEASDLTGYATNSSLSSGLSTKANSGDLAIVATSGSYADLANKPSVPSQLNDLSNVDTTGVQDGQSLVYQDGEWGAATVASGGDGVTDHGALTGLSDDDHPQYHNDTRGDARYYTKSEIDNSLSGKANSAHNHSWQDITTGTQPAPVSHGHAIADVTGLQDELTSLGDALDDKLEASDLTGYATTAALAGKANDGDVVKLSGDQAVAGTKTFSAIPVLPASDPSSANQATRKSYVDTALSGKSNTGHTHLSGDISGLDDTLDFLASEVPRGHEVFYTGTEWPSRPSIIAPRYVAWDSMAYLDAPQPPEMINLDRWKPHPNSEVYDALA